MNARDAQVFAREISIVSALRSPFIILFMGVSISPPELYLITEYMPRGSLHDVMCSPALASSLSIKRRVGMLLDVSRGMQFLHSHAPPIIHRDLTSLNIFVDEDWRCKAWLSACFSCVRRLFLIQRYFVGRRLWNQSA
jgi:serine/threonine protein kinase